MYTNAQVPSSPESITAILGISIEPLSSIFSQMSSLPSAVSKPPASAATEATKLAERIVKHLFNYVSGFVEGGSGVTPESLVPMGVIAKWYEVFLAKTRNTGIEFLERQE